MNELISNYVAVDAICAFSLFILVHASRRNVFFIYEMKKQFAIAAFMTIIVIAAEIGSVVFENVSVKGRAPIFIANVIGFSFSPFIAVILSKAFSLEKGKTRAVLTIPAWINFVFVISSPWTGLIFNVSGNNYLRGPLFGMYCFLHMGFCYRVGGDEFCVICRTTDEQNLKDALCSFHEKIDEIRKRSDVPNELPMVSTGYALFFNLEKGYTEAMKEADNQMYSFKNKRKQSL